MSELLSDKQLRAVRHSERQKAYYLRERAWAINELGGKCMHCGRTDNLEIHHKEPKLRHTTPGGTTIRDWRQLIPQGKMTLSYEDCHVENEHDGNTNSLKKKGA